MRARWREKIISCNCRIIEANLVYTIASTIVRLQTNLHLVGDVLEFEIFALKFHFPGVIYILRFIVDIITKVKATMLRKQTWL